MDQFHHGPMLTVNVGIRHWRFMERLGISCARWFEHEGFGSYTGLRAPMVVGGEHMPLAEQASTARNTLFSMSYREIERRIREQMTAMFGAYGFAAKRDIAGLITNRWGHAYVTPQPGFYFGLNGKPAPRDAVRKGYGRVRFGHSELTGFQLWDAACDEGERAVRQVMEII